jgi:phosphonate transport system substrate-binding protein
MRFTTLQAPNQAFVIQQIATYVGQQLGLRTTFVDDLPWQERVDLLEVGQVDVSWMCGLYYVRKADQSDCALELLAAPVMSAARYQDRPIYFSDIIVRRQSKYQTFGDLQGVGWAYNEVNSHSGYNITRYYLASLGVPQPYFGRVVAAGSHERSIEMVLQNEVDAAAIDSTVLAIAQELDHRVRDELRIIVTTPPSPIPPLVISQEVPAALRQEIRQVLVEMDGQQKGRYILQKAGLKRWAVVTDRDYDPIRDMDKIARTVTL